MLAVTRETLAASETLACLVPLVCLDSPPTAASPRLANGVDSVTVVVIIIVVVADAALLLS